MPIPKVLSVIVTLTLLSCNNAGKEPSVQQVSKNDTIPLDSLKLEDLVEVTVADGNTNAASNTNVFITDRYPVPDELISGDKPRLTNDTLHQTLVYALTTEEYRAGVFHFDNNDIPADLATAVSGGTASKVKAAYFTTTKGFRLGDAKQKAIDTYGKPDKRSTAGGVEKLEWEFVGETVYDGKADLKGKPLAKDSFGHYVVMYFRNDKLIAQVLYNDLP